jgi:hypothetical protein
MVATSNSSNASKQATSAGVLIYLVEELGDARLRCAQLKALKEDVVGIIEASEHKEEIFEVAGHLIQSIPDVIFRLDKALDAAAIAAARLDYEELKQNVRPEKVDELDQVYDDVRLRYVQRRSGDMTPQQVAEKVAELAASVGSGDSPVTKLAALAEYLGVASVDASGLRRLSEDLQKTPRASRAAVASQLISCLVQAGDEKESRFEEGKPADPTKNMDPEDAEEWEDMNDKYEDKFKKNAGGLWEKGSWKWMFAKYPGKDPETGERISKGQVILYNVVSRKAYAGSNASEKAKRDGLNPFPDTSAARQDLLEYLNQRSEVSYNPRRRERGGDPYWDGDQLVFPATGTVMTGQAAKDAWARFQAEKMDEDLHSRYSRYEKGKPADPTENMSEEDAKVWWEMHEKYKDQLTKEAAADLTKSQVAKLMKEHGIDGELSGSGSKWELEVDEKNEKLFRRQVRKLMPGVALGGYKPGWGGWVFKPGHYSKGDFSEHNASVDRTAANPKPKFKVDDVVEDSNNHKWKIESAGDYDDYLEQYKYRARPESGGTRKWIRENSHKLVKNAAVAEDKESRFEEGKPADPTKDMSEEDAATWWQMHEKYKGELKKEAGEVNVNRLDRMVVNTETQLKEMKHSLEMYKKDPGKYQPQLDNFKAAVRSVQTMAEATLRIFEKTAGDAGLARDTKTAGYDLWIRQLSKAYSEGVKEGKADLNDVQTALRSLTDSAQKLASDAGGKTSPLGNPIGLFSQIANSSWELAYAVGGTKEAVSGSKWSSSEPVAEDKESRFEEGKPADPTENMTPEDEAEWWRQHAKNKDKFKEGSGGDGYYIGPVASTQTAGKAQDFLRQKVKRLAPGEVFELSEMSHGYKGHFKELMSAARELAKKGEIEFDGVSRVVVPSGPKGT